MNHSSFIRTLVLGVGATVLCAPMLSSAQNLSHAEKKLVTYVNAHLDQQLADLEIAVNIDSGTYNPAGVKAVGAFFGKQLESLGFTVRWIDMPESMHRAGHLLAERVSAKGTGKRVLLVGHLDTIFEGEAHRFRREGDTIRGAGVTDMKGGDTVILYALKALHAAGELEGATVRVFLTGDEENPGLPTAISRKELVDVSRKSDVALSFEADSGKFVIGRRGLSTWNLKLTGVQGHSAGVLKGDTGAGANYESARIIDGIRIAYTGHPTVTINPSLVVGGTDVTSEPLRSAGSAMGKFNVVAKAAHVSGDLRFLTDEDRDQAKAKLTALAAASLPKTTAGFLFDDMVPGWPASEQGRALLKQASQVSEDLGQGPKVADDPSTRGFGDANFFGPLIPTVDGLGVSGEGAHGPNESLKLQSLASSTSRAAVLVSRLIRRPK